MSKNPSNKLIIEWSALKGALVVVIFSLIIGIAGLVSSHLYRDEMNDWERLQRNNLGKIQAEYSQIQEILSVTDTFYYTEFKKMMAESFFQIEQNTLPEDRRLNMVEQVLTVKEKIEGIVRQLKILTARWGSTYSEQSLYSVPAIATQPDFKVYETKLTLELGLLHEVDVLRLLKSIEFQRPAGLFNIKSCDVKRIAEIKLNEPVKPYFQATCVLLWYIARIEKAEDHDKEKK
jgi:hypothetical protein